MDLFKGLNENQIKAVRQVNGPVMVIAGAGSGKTRVLTHRLAYLVSEGVKAENILAVTFTNKAAKEMQERADKLLEDKRMDGSITDNSKATICTFHSLCAKILRKEAEALGYKRSFEIFDEDESIKTLKKVFEELHFDKTQYKEKNFKNLISLLKNGKSLPMMDETMKYDFERCYSRYNERLKTVENAMDFDDLLLNTVELFSTRSDILEYYQRKFIYIMVDEYQDTNDIQYDLICLLSEKIKNIFVVGDGDQSIYSFRNANVGNINKFIKKFNPVQIILNTNYRSTQYILSAANSLINKNNNRIKKDLVAFKDDGIKPKLKVCDTMNDELLYIKNKVLSLHDRGYNYSDMAVFYRTNSLSRNVEEIFMKSNIPYRIYGGLSFFSRKEVKDILAYLKLIMDRSNVWAFKRVVNEPKRGIGNKTLEQIDDLITMGYSLNDAIININNKKVNDFMKLIDFLEETFKTTTITNYIDVLVKTLDYEKIYEDEEDRLDNINELKSVLEEADEAYDGTDFEKLNEMLLYLSLRTDKEENKPGGNTVSLMTYHQAKGLEFPIVFMMAMEDGIFPSSLSIFASEAEVEEERRIAYVGITRAEERLYLSYAKNRMLYGETRYSRISRFVKEINPNFIENEDEARRIIFNSNTNSKDNSYSTPINKPKYVEISEDTSNISYNIGDKVNHKVFGDGIIVGMDDLKLTIAFKAEFGIKKIAKGHPTLSKI